MNVPPSARPAPAIDGSPPVSPTEVPGEKAVGRNTLDTLLFRGLSTPIALLLVVIQSRFLAPSGRGTFVLVVLSVTILSRLLGQLGLAVTARGTEFVTFWGGATLPAWRGRGIYRALVAHRATLAAERGRRYIEVDASDDSRPILERLGFIAVTTTTPYVWSPPVVA